MIALNGELASDDFERAQNDSAKGRDKHENGQLNRADVV